MKQLPRKAAENAHLMGSWQTEGLCYKVHRSKRRAYHIARRQGRTGEAMDRKFERHTRRTAKNAAARMKA
jgi:hypothetical protein